MRTAEKMEDCPPSPVSTRADSLKEGSPRGETRAPNLLLTGPELRDRPLIIDSKERRWMMMVEEGGGAEKWPAEQSGAVSRESLAHERRSR